MRKDANHGAGYSRGSLCASGQPRGAGTGILLWALIALLSQPALALQLVTYAHPAPAWPFGPPRPTAPTSGSDVIVIAGYQNAAMDGTFAHLNAASVNIPTPFQVQGGPSRIWEGSSVSSRRC
jgi:hypothetical protein